MTTSTTMTDGSCVRRSRRRETAKHDAHSSASETPAIAVPSAPKALTKLEHLEVMLKAQGGATIADLMAATSWQAHSVRGAMAGALRKRGHAITSEKVDGVRRYHIAGVA